MGNHKVVAMSIKLPEELYERLRLVAFLEHVSMAFIVRRCLDKYLEEQEAAPPKERVR